MNYPAVTLLPVLLCCVQKLELSKTSKKEKWSLSPLKHLLRAADFSLSQLLLQLNKMSLPRKHCFFTLPQYLFILPKLPCSLYLFLHLRQWEICLL